MYPNPLVNNPNSEESQSTLNLDSDQLHGGVNRDCLEECVLWILAKLGNPMSKAALRSLVARDTGPWSADQAVEALESFGYRCISYKDLHR